MPSPITLTLTREEALARAERFENMADGASSVARPQELENGLAADIAALRQQAAELRAALEQPEEGRDAPACTCGAVVEADWHRPPCPLARKPGQDEQRCGGSGRISDDHNDGRLRCPGCPECRIPAELRAYPDVRWDRFIEYAGKVRVYGWLDRSDGRSDFLLLDFEAATGRLTDWITSAHPHPASVGERLEGADSVVCQRVEDHFEIPNAVRLSGQPQNPQQKRCGGSGELFPHPPDERDGYVQAEQCPGCPDCDEAILCESCEGTRDRYMRRVHDGSSPCPDCEKPGEGEVPFDAEIHPKHVWIECMGGYLRVMPPGDWIDFEGTVHYVAAGSEHSTEKGDDEHKELSARQQVEAILHQAALASAPEFLWTPDRQAEEAAWLAGRDATVEHISGDLADLPDSLSHREHSTLERLAGELEGEAAAIEAEFNAEETVGTTTGFVNRARFETTRDNAKRLRQAASSPSRREHSTLERLAQELEEEGRRRQARAQRTTRTGNWSHGYGAACEQIANRLRQAASSLKGGGGR